MIFYRLLIYTSYKRAKNQNCIYKLSNKDKILSSLIKEVWRTCTFLNYFREAMSNYYEPCFCRIDFDVIPSYIEIP